MSASYGFEDEDENEDDFLDRANRAGERGVFISQR